MGNYNFMQIALQQLRYNVSDEESQGKLRDLFYFEACWHCSSFHMQSTFADCEVRTVFTYANERQIILRTITL